MKKLLQHIHRPTIDTWIVLIKYIALALTVFVVFMLFKINADSHRLVEQTRGLAEQNGAIAKDNQRHIDCIADLFAQHTRNNQPITIDSLDTCKTHANTSQNAVSNTTSTPRQSLSPQGNPQSNSSKLDNSTPTEPSKNILQVAVDAVTTFIKGL